MLHNFFELITKENLTLIIAVSGLGLSILANIILFKNNRFRVNLIYKSHYVNFEEKVGGIDFNLIVENKSRLPVSISRIYLIVGNNEHEFLTFSKLVHSGDDAYPEARSTALPFTLPGLGAIGSYFSVRIGQPITTASLISSHISIKLVTNRGKKNFAIEPSPISSLEVTQNLDLPAKFVK